MNIKNYFIILLLALFTLVLPHDGYANQQGFGVERVTAYPTAAPVSRAGKVTGENCHSDNDCIVGCAKGQPDDLKCLTLDEASNECVSPDEAPNVDYPCACLPDAHRCGFVFPHNTGAQDADSEHVVKTTNQPPAKHSSKKPTHHHSKHGGKKTPHTKPAVNKPVMTPTPLTEPSHDSGQ